MAKLIHLPKLKQDIIKSVTQTSLNKKYGDLVENIIERKQAEKKKITLGKKHLSQIPWGKGSCLRK